MNNKTKVKISKEESKETLDKCLQIQLNFFDL